MILSIVLIGLAFLMIWKIFTSMRDRREFAKFERERMMAKWDTVSIKISHKYLSSFTNIFHCVSQLHFSSDFFNLIYKFKKIMLNQNKHAIIRKIHFISVISNLAFKNYNSCIFVDFGMYSTSGNFQQNEIFSLALYQNLSALSGERVKNSTKSWL